MIGDLVESNAPHMLCKNYDSLICSHYSEVLVKKGERATVIDSSNYQSYFLNYKVAIKVLTSQGVGWAWSELYSET